MKFKQGTIVTWHQHLLAQQIGLLMCTMQHHVFEAAVCYGHVAMWSQALKSRVYTGKLNTPGIAVWRWGWQAHLHITALSSPLV